MIIANLALWLALKLNYLASLTAGESLAVELYKIT